MEHYQEVMVALSESVIKKSPEAPPGGQITMTSYPACKKTLLSRKPCIPDKKLLWNYQEVMVALSGSIMKNRVKRPLVVKSRWRHIQLAKKPWCLENHAWQIKSYSRSLSWSLDRLVSFIKQQILIQKTYQFINVVNGVSHSHKTENIFFLFDSVA